VGLKVPQEEAGAQLQSTPALDVSLVTVAEIVAVPPAAKVEGGACVNAIVTLPAGVDDEELLEPPQPEILSAKIKNSRPAIHSDGHSARTFFTTSSSLVELLVLSKIYEHTSAGIQNMNLKIVGKRAFHTSNS